MGRSCLTILIITLCSVQAWGLDTSRYHTQEEINGYLRSMAKLHRPLVRHHHLGYSAQGREISYLVVGHERRGEKPAIYLNATHHGNEKASTEALLGLTDFLIKERHRSSVAKVLDTYDIYLQPLVNPDGHALNRREDAFGRDPNRNYSYPGRADDKSFQIPSVRLVKELADRVRFRAAAAFHAGLEAVLWPVCFDNQQAEDQNLFYTLSKRVAGAMGITRFLQSYWDYPTQGEFIDYVYLNHGTIAVTIEVDRQWSPPPQRLPTVIKRSIAGAMAFMVSILEHDRGELMVESAPEVPQTGSLPTHFAN